MNELLTTDIKYGLESSGYFLIVTDDEKLKKDITNEIQLNGVELLSDYDLVYSADDIKSKLKTNAVTLLDINRHVGEYFQKNMQLHSLDEAIYYSLLQYREYTRNHPIVIICDYDTARIMKGYDANLGSWVDVIFADNERYKGTKKLIKNKDIERDY